MRVEHPPDSELHPGIGPDPGGEALGSWLRRHGVAIFLGLLAGFAGVVILIEVGPSGLFSFSPQTAPSVVNPHQAEFDPVIRRIYDVANQAVRERRSDLLDQAYAPDCQCYAQVKATIDRLVANHLTLGGAGMQVVAVEVELAKPDVAILRVTDKIDPYPEYGEGGALVATLPGRGALQFTETLERKGTTWLMTDAVPAANALP